MLKTFPIDFIRQAFEQKLFEEHQKNPHLFGGKNQVNIFSFYEQLKNQEQVDRFVETYRDLTDQQNRTGLILNGVLVSPENPTITNLYSSTIIPMSWTCSMRCTLENRDASIVTINNLIKELKGKKVDISQLNCVDDYGNKYTEPFMVGTIGQGSGEPTLKNGDFVGSVANANEISSKFVDLSNQGVVIGNDSYFYCQNDNKIKVAKKTNSQLNGVWSILEQIYDDQDYLTGAKAKFVSRDTFTTIPYIIYPTRGFALVSLINEEYQEVNCDIEILSCVLNNQHIEITMQFNLDNHFYDGYVDEGVVEAGGLFIYLKFNFIEDDGSVDEIVFPPEHTSFEKYKVSFSFDAIRCDEPRNLNEKEYCELSFSGSATLVSDGVQFGNDLLKIAIKKKGFQTNTYVDLTQTSVQYYLEPLELPSGSNANTLLNQLSSNKFLNNSHTDALSLTLQYTFIYDKNIQLLKEWFDYARYGTQGLTSADITPNLEYIVDEIWCSWGDYEDKQIITKIVENIDIENTESDVLTLTFSMQIQGENH